MENITEMFLRMLKERQNYYNKEWEKCEIKGFGQSAALNIGKANAYENTRIMFEYVLAGNKEALAQFDYFGEE
jgi:hypothetical protein